MADRAFSFESLFLPLSRRQAFKELIERQCGAKSEYRPPDRSEECFQQASISYGRVHMFKAHQNAIVEPMFQPVQPIYVSHYRTNRGGRSVASAMACAMESWMHRKVAEDVSHVVTRIHRLSLMRALCSAGWDRRPSIYRTDWLVERGVQCLGQ